MTPNDFPYITAIHVNDCFAYQNFDINLPPLNGKPFSHLILTGKNGSGKTTILRGVEQRIGSRLLGVANTGYIDESALTNLLNLYRKSNAFKELEKTKTMASWFRGVQLLLINNNQLNRYSEVSVFSFFVANRQINVEDVSSATKETEFANQLKSSNGTSYFTQKFKQYLVNKKIQQAFSQLNKNSEGIQAVEQFFERFIKILKRFFEDDTLTLDFDDRNFDFKIVLKDKRQITFNQLSEGFSAFISILADLLIRVDLIRSSLGDYTYEPCGIVLLDEPEGHLHIKAQYDVLPILTEFFPNVQFIVATHSPAVISSIKNTTVFDITRQTTVTDEIVGRSYSELMVTQFGLDNEFSPIADEILDNIGKVLKENKGNKPLLKQKLQNIMWDNRRYLSPVLRLEIESLIIDNS